MSLLFEDPGGSVQLSKGANNALQVNNNILFSPSTAGLKGTTTADNAAAGVVGELLSIVQSSNVALTTAVTANIATLSLTAGDWDVDGVINFNPSAAPTALSAGIATTSATLPNPVTPNGALNALRLTFTAAVQTMPTGTYRVNVSATTNVYLVAQATFSSGNCQTTGFMRARRVR